MYIVAFCFISFSSENTCSVFSFTVPQLELRLLTVIYYALLYLLVYLEYHYIVLQVLYHRL